MNSLNLTGLHHPIILCFLAFLSCQMYFICYFGSKGVGVYVLYLYSLIYGWSSFMADSLISFDISIFLVYCLLPFSNKFDIKQSIFALLFLKWTYHTPSAITG